MGCDIHPALEISQWVSQWESPPGEWDFVAIPPRGRNYDFFGHLAGVRGGASNCFSEPRGLPRNLSMDSVNFLMGGLDGHSASYITLSEMVSYRAKTKVEPGERWTRCWDEWIELMSFYFTAYGLESSDRVRIVFDFDN